MTRVQNWIGMGAAALLAGALTVATTAGFAMPRYDGLWSVSIVTTRGDCIASYRYPMRIANGILANGGDITIDVAGRVGGDGNVTVILSHGDTRASGFGRLAANTGAPAHGAQAPARVRGRRSGVRKTVVRDVRVMSKRKA
jgi:hypothetical protein